MKAKLQPRTRLALLALLTFPVYLALALTLGPLVTPDGQVLHDLAVALAEWGYGSPQFEQKLAQIRGAHQLAQPIAFYRLYLYFLAALDVLFGPGWIAAHMVVNAAAMSLTGYLCLRVSSRLMPGRLPEIATLLGLMACWEYLQWATMTQSEPLFYLITMSVVAMILAGLDGADGARCWGWLAGAALIAAGSLLLRPTGLPLAVFAALVLLAAALAKGLGRRLSLRAMALVLIAAVPLGLPISAAVLLDPSLLPDVLAPKFAEYRALVANGVVVNARPETYLAAGDGYLHFLTVGAAKFAYFFAFQADEFSPNHNLVNLAYYLPFYALAAISLVASLAGAKAARQAGGEAMLVMSALVLLFAAFHAATLVDFDWRYRSPTHPVMTIIAVHGGLIFLRMLDRLTRAARRGRDEAT